MAAMSSEGGSSKSATIEMYAPSSYNETVNGETLSSISEKSESYSQNGSHSDYAVSLVDEWFSRNMFNMCALLFSDAERGCHQSGRQYLPDRSR
jgi:hypothetical protein